MAEKAHATMRLEPVPMSDLVLEIVTRGWDLPGWADDFYPLDLPPEWRLTYFSNEFPAVLVPASVWRGADAGQLRAWVDDVNSGFRFYLELPRTPSCAGDVGAAVPVFGGRLAGVVGGDETPPGLSVPHFRWRNAPLEAGESVSAVACRVPGHDMDLRAARAWLESLVGRLEGGPGLVIVDGRSVGADDLRRWLELAWMLGFA